MHILKKQLCRFCIKIIHKNVFRKIFNLKLIFYELNAITRNSNIYLLFTNLF